MGQDEEQQIQCQWEPGYMGPEPRYSHLPNLTFQVKLQGLVSIHHPKKIGRVCFASPSPVGLNSDVVLKPRKTHQLITG